MYGNVNVLQNMKHCWSSDVNFLFRMLPIESKKVIFCFGSTFFLFDLQVFVFLLFFPRLLLFLNVEV